MTTTPSTDASDGSLTRDLLHAARYYLGGTRTLLLVAAVAIVGGIALNWDWLVAAGIAPILLAVLPCAVMCGLGLCMHKMSSRSGGCCATKSSQPTEIELRNESATPSLSHSTAIQDALDCCHGASDATAPASTGEPRPVADRGETAA